MVYDADQFVANARATHANAPGYCLQVVRGWAGIAAKYPDASTAWRNAKDRHPGDRNPPKGAVPYWTGGGHGYGHIAASEGGGKIRSTDCTSSGQTGTTDLGWVERAWGLTYAGWAWDINGVTIPHGASGGSGGGSSGKDDTDMPDYGKAKHTKPTPLTDGTWYPIDWDTVAKGDYFKGPDISITGYYTASLGVDVGNRGDATVQTDWVERADDKVQEGSPIASHGKVDKVTDARTGMVPKGRKLRARVRVVGSNATLQSAQIDLLTFRTG